MIAEILLFAGAYFVGAIPFGAWIARVYGINDITRHGSGGSGATNVARVLGKPFFFLVFLFDAVKAAAYIFVMQTFHFSEFIIGAAALLLVVGNCYSLFLHGRGGKGIATTIGIILMLMPNVIVLLFPFWFVVACCTHMIGIASTIALLFLPFVMIITKQSLTMVITILIITAIGLWRHYDHLARCILYLKCARSKIL